MTTKRCKYCLKPLDSNGFCTRPCYVGKLIKRKAELEKLLAEKRANSQPH